MKETKGKMKDFWITAYKIDGTAQTNMKEATRDFMMESVMRDIDSKRKDSRTLWQDNANASTTPSVMVAPRLKGREHWAPGTQPKSHTHKRMFPDEESDDSSSDDSSSSGEQRLHPCRSAAAHR